MPTLDGTTCPKCGARIFLAKTTQGQQAPFDAEPISVYGADEKGVMQNQGKGHRIHFQTCTNPGKKAEAKPTTIDKVFPDGR